MFGFLALGFFTAMAITGAFGDGKSGSPILGLLGVTSIKELFDGTYKKNKEKKKEEEAEKKEKELHDLLKKKPEDLSEKDKKRIEEIRKDLKDNYDVEIEDVLNEKEMKNLSEATGYTPKSQEELEQEQQQERQLLRNKGLALMQMQLEKIKDDDSPEAEQAREDYNSFIECIYNDKGEPLSEKEITANLGAKKELLERLEKQATEVAKDEKLVKEFQESAASVTDEQASQAAEQAKTRRVSIAKKANLEKQRAELEADSDNSKLLKKYSDFEFSDGLTPGDLSSTDSEKKKQVEEQLKSAGLDPKLYKKVQNAKSERRTNDKGEPTEPTQEELLDILGSDLSKDKKRQINEVNKEIEKVNKDISGKSQTNEPKEPKKKEPKMTDNEVVLLDEDGEPTGEKIVKKEDGSFKKVDVDGNETDATKDDWNDARTEFQESDWDGDEDNSQEDNDADKDVDTDSETDKEKKDKKADRDENGKRVNPAKVWHRKKKKNGSGSTKSYYNSKGDSISGKDFKEKMNNYKQWAANHKKQPKESIVDTLKRKLIIEHILPKNDITQYLKSCF